MDLKILIDEAFKFKQQYCNRVHVLLSTKTGAIVIGKKLEKKNGSHSTRFTFFESASSYRHAFHYNVVFACHEFFQIWSFSSLLSQ